MYKFSLQLLSLVLCLNITETNAQQIINAPLNAIGISNNGFTSNIQKITEDKNNFLWFSTEDALCKFDGTNIIRFTKDNSGKRNILGINSIAMEYKNADDLLYVLSGNEGLNIINVNTNVVEKQINFQKAFGDTNPEFYNAMIRIDNRLLIITNSNKYIYYNVDTRAIEKIGKIPISPQLNIQALCSYKNHICVILSDNTLCFLSRIDLNVISQFVCSNDKRSISVKKSQVINNRIWLATTTGICCINLDTGKELDVANELPNFPKDCIDLFTSDLQLCDNYIIFSNEISVFIYDIIAKKYSKLVSNKSEEDENFLRSASAFLYKNNQLWIGGPFGVASIKNLHPTFSSFYKNIDNGSIRIGQAFCICPSVDQNILVSAEDGLYQVDIGYNTFDKLISKQYINSILKIDSGVILLSGTKDLLIYKGNKIISAAINYPELKALSKDVFCSMELLDKNKVLFVSIYRKGLYLWDERMHTVQKFDKQSTISLPSLQLRKVWVEEPTKNVFLLSQTSLQLINFEEKQIKIVFDFQKMGNDKYESLMDVCSQKTNYWIAAYGFGIVELNSKFEIIKTLTTKDGIPNLGVYKIFNIGDSVIVATTNNGLVVYNIKQNKIRTYYEEDGLQSSSFNQLSGYQQGDTLYIGGVKGFTIFDTKKYKTNDKPPQLYFNTITYETPNGTIDTTNLFIKKLEIPNNVTQTKISFIGLNYANPKRVQYWYRINGLQDNWLALQNQNFITLIGINPSKYILEIKAANEDGVECSPISMELHFLPKWYQTMLFKITILLAIIILLYTLYSFRIRQLKKVLSIRQKIASDLHDDIGGTLSGIRILTNLAIEQNPKDYLAQIKAGVTDATTAVKDTIWVMDRTKNNALQLVEKIKAFIVPLANASNIKIDIQIGEGVETIQLGPDERHDLYLITKEFTNNSLKYAQCKNIVFQIIKYSKKISLTIIDDGVGFDLNSVPRGNGINNICARAANIGYQANFIAAVNSGTMLQVFPRTKNFLDKLYQNRYILRIGRSCAEIFRRKKNIENDI